MEQTCCIGAACCNGAACCSVVQQTPPHNAKPPNHVARSRGVGAGLRVPRQLHGRYRQMRTEMSRRVRPAPLLRSTRRSSGPEPKWEIDIPPRYPLWLGSQTTPRRFRYQRFASCVETYAPLLSGHICAGPIPHLHRAPTRLHRGGALLGTSP